MFWNVAFLVAFVVYAAILMMGVQVFRNNHDKNSNKFFLLFTFTFVAWLLANFMSIWIQDISFAQTLLYIDFVLAPFFTLYLLLFLLSFPKERVPINKLTLSIAHVLPVLTTVFITLGLVISNIMREGDRLVFTEGPLFEVYYLIIAAFVFGGIIYAAINRFTLKGLEKRQSQAILVGFALVFTILFISNVFFQNVLDTKVLALFNLSSILLPICISVAVLRDRFMGLKTIYKSYFEFVVLFLFVLLYSQVWVFVRVMPELQSIPYIGTSTILAALFVPLFLGLRVITKRASNEIFSSAALIRESFKEIAHEVSDMNTVGEKVSHIVERVELATGSRPTFLVVEEGEVYAEYGNELHGLEIEMIPEFFEHTSSTSKRIIKSEMKFSAIVPGGMKQDMMHLLDRHKVQMIFPIIKDNHVQALLLMPDKVFGYTADEVALIESLALKLPEIF